MSVHVEPIRTYLLVFAALMGLTVVTVAVAYFDFGAFNDVIAMTIAIVKATLVVLIFMHVRHSSRLTKMTVVAGIIWLLIMFLLTMGDFLSRELLLPFAGG